MLCQGVNRVLHSEGPPFRRGPGRLTQAEPAPSVQEGEVLGVNLTCHMLEVPKAAAARRQGHTVQAVSNSNSLSQHCQTLDATPCLSHASDLLCERSRCSV